MNELQFPETVPYLKPNHIHKGWYTGPNNTHCLIGWVNAVFTDSATRNHVVDILSKEISAKRLTQYPCDIVVMCFNDDENNSKRRICRVWNRAMKKLGYTEKV